MQHPVIAILLVPLGLAQLATGLAAQDPVDHLRGVREMTLDVSGVPQTKLELSKNFGANPVTIRWVDTTTANTLASLVLPFHRAGEIAMFAPGEYLVSGLEYTSWSPAARHGKLVKLAVTASPTYAITSVGSVDLPTIDPVSLAYNATGQRIYLLDRNTRSVKVASYTSWGAGLPGESAFATAASSSAISFMKTFWGGGVARRGGGGIASIPLAVGVQMGSRTRADYLTTIVPGATWAITDNPTAYPLRIKSSYDRSNEDPIEMLCDASLGATSWGLFRVDTGTTVGSGSITSGQWQTLSSLSLQIKDYPGMPYELQLLSPAGIMTSRRVSATVRYGVPLSAPGFTVLEPKMLLECVIGDQDYGVAVDLDHVLAAGPSSQVTATLWSAFRTVAGDPVTIDPQSGFAVLSPDFTSSWTFDAQVHRSAIGVNVPIANDPVLAGNVVLWQWVFTLNGGSVAASRVFGTSILGAGAALKSISKDSGSLSKAQIARAKKSAIARRDFGDSVDQVEVADLQAKLRKAARN